MKNVFAISLLYFLIFLVHLPNTNYSAEIGLYFSPFNTGKASVDWDDENINTNNWNISYWGVGIVYNDQVDKKGTFKYLMNFGYEKINYIEKRSQGNTHSSKHRLKIDNTLGISVIKSGSLCLWFGPQLRLAFEGFPSVKSSFIDDGGALGIGIAPVMGVNINLGNAKSISFDFGYRNNRYAGSCKTGTGFSAKSWHSSIDEEEFFFNISYMFINSNTSLF